MNARVSTSIQSRIAALGLNDGKIPLHPMTQNPHLVHERSTNQQTVNNVREENEVAVEKVEEESSSRLSMRRLSLRRKSSDDTPPPQVVDLTKQNNRRSSRFNIFKRRSVSMSPTTLSSDLVVDNVVEQQQPTSVDKPPIIPTAERHSQDREKPPVPPRRHTVVSVERPQTFAKMHSELANKLIKRLSVAFVPTLHVEEAPVEPNYGFVTYVPQEEVTAEVLDTHNEEQVKIVDPQIIALYQNSTEEQIKSAIVFQKYTRRWLAIRRYKRMIKRKKCALEILSTEQSYVYDIQLVSEIFLEPLKRLASTPRPIITRDQISHIFSDLEVILQVNRTFLHDLESVLDRYTNYTIISSIILSISPFFKTYSRYCNNYAKSQSTLAEAKKDSDIRPILLSMEKDKRLSKGALSSYLILPIQRIPRYRLLLQELIKQTEKDHPDYENLHKALDSICKVAGHLNATMKTLDRTNEIIQVQNKFTTEINLIEPHRSFVLTGKFKEIKEVDNVLSETGRVYALHLFSDVIVVSYLTESDEYLFRFAIKLRNALLLDYIVAKEDRDHLDDRIFKLESPDGRVICGASSVMEKNAWLKSLHKTISENKSTHKNNSLRINSQSLDDRQSTTIAVALSGENETLEMSTGECIQKMKQGSTMLKYCSRGKPHFRTFVITSDERHIVWFSPNKSTKKSQVSLAEVSTIVPGQKTAIFAKHRDSYLESLSFSLIYKENKTLDIACKDRKEYMLWLTGLQYLLSFISQGKISPTADVVGTAAQVVRTHTGSGKQKLKEKFEQIGDLYTFGQGSRGALGHGNETDQTVPLVVKDFLYLDVASVACANSATAAITLGGEVFTFGSGEKGRLGHGDSFDRIKACLVKGLVGHKIVKIALGAFHTMALEDNGRVWVFGSSDYGQLGLGSNFVGENAIQLTPLKLPALQKSTVRSIACGDFHSGCIVEGMVLIWGRGEDGQCGQGNKNNLDVPTVVSELYCVKAVDLALGMWHSIVLTEEGQIYSFGSGMYGQLGHGDTNEQLKPKKVDFFSNSQVVKVSAGSGHTACITSAGQLYCWGLGIYGQIGNNERSNVSIPTLITSLTGVKDIVCGSNHSLAQLTSGKVYSWGAGSYGRLGLKEEREEATPKEITFFEDKTVRVISAGGNQSACVCAHQWVPDKDSTQCMHCHANFTFTRRRHHCRYCGGLFCGSCTTKRIAVLRFGITKPVRVCDFCHSILSNQRSFDQITSSS